MKIRLVNGRDLPAIGLGTWQLRGAACRKAVSLALELGYRHIDTAQMYDNETEIGVALTSTAREDVFVTTKVWPTHYAPDALRQAVDASLRKLRSSYVDLLLLHWPPHGTPLRETVEALNAVAQAGKARAIGVSNFSVALMQEAQSYSALPLACHQVRWHVGMDISAVRTHALAHDMVITAYSPLGEGRLPSHRTLGEMARKYGRTPSQVALRWLLEQEGTSVIPKATSLEHLKDNLAAADFALEAKDRDALAALRI